MFPCASRAALAVLLLGLAAAHCALAATPPGRNGRELLQSGVSCFAQIPACTARRCTTRILDSKETYVCLRCQRGFVPSLGSDGRSIVQCVCPAGTYQNVTGSGASAVRSCQPCPAGSYCPGGDKNAKLPTDNYGGENKQCNQPNTDGLTTKSTKSSKASDCVAKAGYVLPASRNDPAQQCTGNSYAPNFNRLKTCLPCQSGLQAPDDFNGTRADKNEVCQVPPGKFWELNVVRDCPKGLYRPSYAKTDNKTAINCLSCPEGWTTSNIASTALRQCNVLMPGYKIAGLPAGNNSDISIDPQSGDFVPQPVEVCPVGYYNDGTTLACVRCPYGSTTLKNGSTTADDCMVPPGYFVRTSAGVGEMVKCPTTDESVANATALAEGYYRAGWKSFKEVMSQDGTGKDACTKCGEGILSRAVETDELPDAPADSKVAATSASCFIKGGWGMSFDPLNMALYKAIRPCPANMYGVTNDTFGLFNAPCKACTKNLYSLAGSNKFSDCKNPGGFGYTSEGANQCPDGFWAAKDSMNPCEPCPEGRTTFYQPGNGTYQDSLDDCIVPPGSGIYNGNSSDPWNPTPSNNLPAKPCPVGFYAAGEAGGNTTSNPTCLACTEGASTTGTGSTTCNACMSGFGKADAKSSCTLCPFGTYNFGNSDSCNSCPSTTYNDPMGDGYSSYGITFKRGMDHPDACVPRYAQLPNPAGDRMALPDGMFTQTIDVSTESSDEKAVKKCVEACPADKCCIAEMAKDDNGVMCKHARLTPTHAMYEKTAKLFYKIPPSEFAAASVKNKTEKDDAKVNIKTIGSGLYAACDIDNWREDAVNGLVGTSPNPLLVEAGRNATEWNTEECDSIASCKATCLTNAACWGFIVAPIEQNGATVPGYALRGGEMFLGGRTFFVSPDGSKLAADDGTIEVVESWSSLSS